MRRALNFIDGQWVELQGLQYLPVFNPATAEALGEVPLSTAEVVDRAAPAAARALHDWGRAAAD